VVLAGSDKPYHAFSGNSTCAELRQLQMQQRQGLSMISRPLATCKFFLLALSEQVGAACRYVAGSRALYGSLLAVPLDRLHSRGLSTTPASR